MSEESRKPMSRRRLAVIAVALLALLYGGFEIGRRTAGYSIVDTMIEATVQRRRNRELAAQNQELQRRVATAELGQRVDRQTQSDAQRMMSELQAETSRQQQELQFYRGLVARQFGAGTLRVQELRVRAEEERRYRVLITLVLAATRESLASGTVTLTIEGQEGTTLSLAEIEADRRSELPFSLRFFQQIEVPIELPLDFEPVSLHVEYRLGRNAEPVRQSFPWRVEGGAATPVL